MARVKMPFKCVGQVHGFWADASEIPGRRYRMSFAGLPGVADPRAPAERWRAGPGRGRAGQAYRTELRRYSSASGRVHDAGRAATAQLSRAARGRGRAGGDSSSPRAISRRTAATSGEARIAAYVAAGHVIGNHSHSHGWLWNGDAAAYVADLDKAEAWLAGRPGKRPWYRFPISTKAATPSGATRVRAALKAARADERLRHGRRLRLGDRRPRRKAVEAGRPIDRAALGELYVETIVDTADFYDRIAPRGARPLAGARAAAARDRPRRAVHRRRRRRPARRRLDDRHHRRGLPPTRSRKASPTRSTSAAAALAALAAAAGRDPEDLVYERNRRGRAGRGCSKNA